MEINPKHRLVRGSEFYTKDNPISEEVYMVLE